MPTELRDRPQAIAALIVAAGRGLRAGGDQPKQYRDLNGRPVLVQTLARFAAESSIGHIQVVIGPEDRLRYDHALGSVDTAKLLPPVVGGDTRQASVLNGLRALAASGFDDIVLVHDAARPFVSANLIANAIAAARAHGAAVPGLAVTDTIKQVDDAGLVVETPPRDALRSIQTPQAFAFAPLLAAHEAAEAANVQGLTDDAALMEWAGHPVATFPGDPANIKLTYPQDFERMSAQPIKEMRVRVGTGYDVHAFQDGDHAWIGGVRIPHDRGVLAHSDGDVALHALTDALLGTLAEGDIGTHFPPSDPQWKGAASMPFLTFAADRVRARGGKIDFLDLTLVCEAPKIGPHRDAMRQAIAAGTGVRVDQISIKATTSERLGFTGRREGLAALATVTVRLPVEE